MATATTDLPNPRSNQSRKLKCSIPRWSKARDLKKLVPVVFGVGPIIRIVGVSVIVGGAICLGVKLAFPQIQLGFAAKALLAIPAMFAYLGFWFLVHLLVPGEVKITERHILVSNGQSAWRAKLADIELPKLVIYSPDHIRLFIRTRGKVRKIALPSSTDLHLLISLLPSTVVIDKRQHFAAARRLVETAMSPKVKGESGSPDEMPIEKRQWLRKRAIVLGVVAAILVPLFLELTGAAIGGEKQLMDQLLAVEGSLSSWFILAGFCLAAAVYSQRFVEAVSNTLLKEIQQEQDDIKEEVKLLENDAAHGAKSQVAEVTNQLTDIAKHVLRAMSDPSDRRPSPKTIAKKSGLEIDQVKDALSELQEKQLVQQRKPAPDGTERWRIRTWGIALALQLDDAP